MKQIKTSDSIDKDKNETAKNPTITRINRKVNLKKDFSETLEITRTLFKSVVSKTSIVETALCCSSANSESFTVKQIATFIISNLNVKDCFHKKDKTKEIQSSTENRVRRHVIHTVKHHYKADKLYSFDKKTDSVCFTDMYQAFCKENKEYRKHISALIARIKIQYKVAKKTVKKKAVKPVKKNDTKELTVIDNKDIKTA